MNAVITVIGEDKIGIIAKVSNMLSDNRINILDINQTIMKDIFTMVMLVDLSLMEIEFKNLSKDLENLGNALSLSIKIQREDIFKSMHRI